MFIGNKHLGFYSDKYGVLKLFCLEIFVVQCMVCCIMYDIRFVAYMFELNPFFPKLTRDLLIRVSNVVV